jgi:hypothetical protein
MAKTGNNVAITTAAIFRAMREIQDASSFPVQSGQDIFENLSCGRLKARSASWPGQASRENRWQCGERTLACLVATFLQWTSRFAMCHA